MRVIHNIPPVFDDRSEILILGSFPSPKSRDTGFFYGHPQNRFWAVMTEVMGWEHIPVTVEEKRAFLLTSRVALWDVVGECEIDGAQDSSIREVIPNDVGRILSASRVTRVFCNGGTAFSLYRKYLLPVTGIQAHRLPSTSPANAALSKDALVSVWRAIISDCKVK